MTLPRMTLTKGYRLTLTEGQRLIIHHISETIYVGLLKFGPKVACEKIDLQKDVTSGDLDQRSRSQVDLDHS